MGTDGCDLDSLVLAWKCVCDLSKRTLGVEDSSIFLDQHIINCLNVFLWVLPFADTLKLLEILVRPASPEVLHKGLAHGVEEKEKNMFFQL